MRKLLLFAIIFIGLLVCYAEYENGTITDLVEKYYPTELQAQKPPVPFDDTKALTVTYLDVGQADATLLICQNEAMLIDAGERAAASSVIEYIQSMGVSSLKYVVATHPHEDHIGGMADVLKAIPAEDIIMPNATHTTKTFDYLLDIIEEKGYEITVPNPGDTFMLGDTKLTVLSPIDKEYDNLNNYSIVLRADYGDTGFLFTADAEKLVESEILDAGYDLKCDVLKVGHHGSNTSSTKDFITAASPTYGIISCGENNDYGHPHEAVLKRLYDKGVELYLTHESGNITIKCDENNLLITTQR